jgi:protein-S-isoprenylcysteine O-methyltransferase Ste14
MEMPDRRNAAHATPSRGSLRHLATASLAMTIAAPAAAATAEGDSGIVGIVIVIAIVVFVLGLGLRVWRSARMSPGWQAFIDRRKAQGRSTKWQEWDDDKEKDK